jgi:hypothetical protein
MNKRAFRVRKNSQSGQVMLFLVLGLGLFLIGSMALAIDLSHLWFRRQAAQTAADAACTAGAMDLLVDASTGSATQGNFTAGTAFDCHTSSTPAPCKYAALNGFNASIADGGTGIGNSVYVDFPASVSGVTTPPSLVAPTPFMRVKVTDNSPTFFAGLLRGLTSQSIRAYALCGVAQSAAPIPILVLDPQSPANATPKQAALNVQGTPTIAIFGGPQRSIQADSLAATSSCGQSNCTVNSPWGTATIDLSHGGPAGTGSDIGISGAPEAAPSGFNGGTTGHWIAPASPIADPFAQVCFPGQSPCTYTINGNSVPAVPGAPVPTSDINSTNTPGCTPNSATKMAAGNCNVPYKFHGCPDSAGCVLFQAGAYGTIDINGGSQTAIFDPGLYYMNGDLKLRSGSLARPGTGAAGTTADGITFYFVGSHTVAVTADSGSRVVDAFNTYKGPVDSSGTQYPGQVAYTLGIQCLSTSTVPSNLQGTPAGTGVNLQGNILLGPCTGYYGDPLGASEPTAASTPPGPGEQRGFLFFQDRSGTNVQPSWGGGGVFTLAGTMYFHSCNSSGTGTNCGSPSTYFNDIFSLGGNSGANTYVLGDIIADNLTLQGTATINMDLNPTNAFNILKASLYQ